MSLPSYLQGSAYAQNYEAAILAGNIANEPLPSMFLDDKAVPPVVSISADKMEVKFIGPVKNSDQDAASVRANFPIPPSTGLFYFEATILSKGRDGFIGVGLCRQDVLLSRLPGWEDDSWGYHGDDGHSFCCQGTGKEYGPKFSTGDVIGCAINFVSGECFYTKNGVHLGVAFTGLQGALYPSIGLRTIGEQVRVNFGSEPFVFDIEHYYRLEKARLYAAVREEEDDISVRVQELVSTYLSHNGYAESARAMAVDISTQSDKNVNYPPIDTEATNRQKLRNHIVNGEIDAALAMLESLFPQVITQVPILYFNLRCRKFIEMMRLCAHLTETDRGTMINEIMTYGQHLNAAYPDPHYRAGLDQTFALLPYADPLDSPLRHIADDSGRVQLAEDINRAILTTSGKSARSELEEIIHHLGHKVTGTAFINIQRDFFSE